MNMDLNLVSKMFIKRFGKSIDRNEIKHKPKQKIHASKMSSTQQISMCMCTCNSKSVLFNHVACVLQGNSFNENGAKTRTLAFGVNHTRFHAEKDAIRKLPPNPRGRGKRLMSISVVVLRLSPTTGKLQSSKPCNRCIHMMNTFPNKRGYTVRNVYYSTSEGKIVKNKLHELTNDENKHMTWWVRNKNNSTV